MICRVGGVRVVTYEHRARAKNVPLRAMLPLKLLACCGGILTIFRESPRGRSTARVDAPRRRLCHATLADAVVVVAVRFGQVAAACTVETARARQSGVESSITKNNLEVCRLAKERSRLPKAKKKDTSRGARTHDHTIKSRALYRLS